MGLEGVKGGGGGRLPNVVEAADVRFVCFGVYACDDGTNEIWTESIISSNSERCRPFFVER